MTKKLINQTMCTAADGNTQNSNTQNFNIENLEEFRIELKELQVFMAKLKFYATLKFQNID